MDKRKGRPMYIPDNHGFLQGTMIYTRVNGDGSVSNHAKTICYLLVRADEWEKKADEYRSRMIQSNVSFTFVLHRN